MIATAVEPDAKWLYRAGGICALLSLGILMIGLVMLRGNFSKVAAYTGLATGILGIVSVAGPFLVSSLALAVIIASVLTTVWLFFVGYRLYRPPAVTR